MQTNEAKSPGLHDESIISSLKELPAYEYGTSVKPCAEIESLVLPEGVEGLLLAIAQGRYNREDLCGHWLLIRNALGWKMRLVLRASFASRGYVGPVTSDFMTREKTLDDLLALQDDPPFTIQRICEILCVENTRPSATHKIINGLERVLQVLIGEP